MAGSGRPEARRSAGAPPNASSTSLRTSSASASSRASPATTVQRPTSSWRTAALTRGTAAGETLSSWTPSPASTGMASSSDAASPQTATSIRPRAARHTWSMSRSTPGSSGSERAATAPLPRSAAIAYWVRSLVPMLTKSTWGRNASIFRAAEGTSIIVPTRRPSGSPAGPAASVSTCRASISSPGVVSIGNMMSIGNRRAVSHIAASWSRSRSRCSRLSRMPRCPRNGLASAGIGRYDSGLSPPTSSVRSVTRRPPIASAISS